MELSEAILLVVIGLFAGVVGGTMGVGGGIVIVPSLVFFMGFTQHQAQGTSLAVLLFPVAILGVINYYKSGYVNFKYALVLILAFVIGSYFGSLLSVHLSDRVLKKVFGIFMLLASLKIIFSK